MKNASLVLNIVLFILVGVLFYLHFSSGSTKKPKVQNVQSAANPSDPSFRIGYFEWDSVTRRFELFKEMQNEINQREDGNEREKVRLRQQYQSRYNSYAQKQMSAVESEIATRDMKALETDISNQMQRMDAELQDYTVRKRKEVNSKIEDFLKEYTQNKSYSFIFANEPGLIFYRDTTYNITEDLINGLNAKYPPAKKK
jgi:outer membrane protein